jgi:RNA polymerase sigma factor (sigma-70 family)
LVDVYRANVKRVYAYFGYHVRADVAEELTATTFERVVRFWDSYDSERRVESWIFAIARHVLADHFRREASQPTISLDAEPQLNRLWATARDPLTRRISVETIKQWLMLLNPRQREIVALRYGADLPPRDIARAVGLSEANVHQILSRAVGLLRRELTAERSARNAGPAGGSPGAPDASAMNRLAPPPGAADG